MTEGAEIRVEGFDEDRIYCRKLGHYLTFKYCRTTSGASVCEKILDCWADRPETMAFLRRQLTDEDLSLLAALPKPKMAAIVELIEKAKARGTEKE